MMKHFLLLAVITVFVIPAFAQWGDNDLTFNSADPGFGNGDGPSSYVYATVVQNDGKILIGGSFFSYNGDNKSCVTRINSDGSSDASFISGGANSTVYTIVVQPDEKIIVGGAFTYFNGTPKNRIVRLNSDGSFDPAFNQGTGANGSIYSVSLQSDGKIIITGNFTEYNGISVSRLARINTDGSLDITFDTGTGANNDVYASLILSSGKILIGGSFTDYNGTAVNRIVMLNNDGSIDNTFNPGTGANNTVYSFGVQTSGKFIIGGAFSTFNGTTVNYITRLNSDGSIDGSFGSGSGTDGAIRNINVRNDDYIFVGGLFSTYDGTPQYCAALINTSGNLSTLISGTDDEVRCSAFQIDGKIIMGGMFGSYSGYPSPYLVRLNNVGTPDTGFNLATGVSGYVRAIAVQSNEKIIIGGGFTKYNGNLITNIARINSDGSIDPTFDLGTSANGAIRTMCIQSDGKIIVGGEFTVFNGTGFNRIVRLNSNGSIDATFTPGTGANNYINAIAVQTDGKIIIGGEFGSYNGTAMNRIARLNSDGTIDASFVTGTGFGAGSAITSIAIQNDNKILVAGNYSQYNGTTRTRITRINPDGSIDLTFDPGASANDKIRTISLQNDGNIIIGGDFTSYNGTSRRGIARLESNGNLDISFDPGNGVNNYANVEKTIIQNDGKIVAVGNFTTFNGAANIRIVRLLPDGNSDNTFVTGSGAGPGPNILVLALALQSDSKLLIGGNFTSYKDVGRNRITRILNCLSTFKTITADDCESYTLNGTNYYSSGIYTQTLVNAAGCDSVITLHLTINNNTGDTTASVCNSFTWHGITYTGSATPTYIYTNSAGCDSVVTLHLFINNNTGDTSATSCNTFTWHGNTYTTSGIYTHTFINSMGCDSVVTLNLTILYSNSASITETACDSIIINGQTYTQSGIHTQVLTNAQGCDSTLSINLTINNSSSSVLDETACNSYDLNGTLYTTSGTFTQTIPNTAGCDSTITLNLTLNASFSSISVTSCNSYTAPDDQVYTNSGIVTAVIPNSAGCDSTITIDLTINTVDTSVTANDPVLTANLSGATYQWLDCNNSYQPIAGETSQVFTAIQNGNYAVEITFNGCTDTSYCFPITSVYVDFNSYADEIIIFPNPFTTSATLKIPNLKSEARNPKHESQTNSNFVLRISDLTGKLVRTIPLTPTPHNLSPDKPSPTQITIELSDLKPGIYFVELNADKIYRGKIIKKDLH